MLSPKRRCSVVQIIAESSMQIYPDGYSPADVRAIRGWIGRFGLSPESILFIKRIDEPLAVKWGSISSYFANWNRKTGLWLKTDGMLYEHTFQCSDQGRIDGQTSVRYASYFVAFIRIHSHPKMIFIAVWPDIKNEKLRRALKEEIRHFGGQ